MQSQHVDTPEEVNMMKLLGKIQTLEAQKSLLEKTLDSRELFASKIISSLQPKVGKTFTSGEMENRKQKILSETRKKLIKLAMEDKEIELLQANTEFSNLKQEYVTTNRNHEGFLIKLERQTDNLTYRLNKNMNKKVSFHLDHQQPPIEFVKKKIQTKKKRKWTAESKKKNRTIYKKKVKMKNVRRWMLWLIK